MKVIMMIPIVVLFLTRAAAYMLGEEEIVAFRESWAYKKPNMQFPKCPDSQPLPSYALQLNLVDNCADVQSEGDGLVNSVFSCQDGLVMDNMPSEEYCYLSDQDLNSVPACNVHTEIVHWAYGTKFSILSEPKMHRRSDPSIIEDYSCNCTTLCASGCRGDETYQKNFKTSENAYCYCEFKEDGGSILFDIDGKFYRPTCWGISKVAVGKKTPLRKLTTCPFCDVDCQGRFIHFKTYGPRVRVITMCRGPICITSSTLAQEIKVELSSEMLLLDNSIEIEYYLDKSPEPTKIVLDCPPISACDLITCYICWEYILMAKCWHYVMIVVVILLILIIASCLAGLKKVLKFVYSLIKPIVCVMYRFFKWFMYKIKYWWQERRARMELEVDIEEGRTELVKTPLYCCILFFALILPTWSCSVSQTMSTSDSECFNKGNGLKECHISQKIRLAISPVGQESCFSLIDDQKKAMGSLVFKTDSVEVKCVESSAYFVPAVELKCISEKHCSGTGQCYSGCPTNGTLANWKYQETFMHKYRCMSSCGCAGCGCFYCTQGCLFAMAYLKSTNHYEMITCSEWQYNVRVDVRLNTGGKSEIREVILRPGQPRRAFNTTIGLISISPVINDISNKCFMRDQYNDLALVECNKRGEYAAGRVGEIQCPDKKSAEIGQNTCFFQDSIIEITDRGVAADCIGHFVSIDNLFHHNRLPHHYPGILIRKTINNTIVADFSSTSLLEMQIDTQGLTMIQTIDKSTCYAEFVSLSGCYSCDSGAKLRLKVKTDIGETVGHLNCPSLDIHIAIPVTPILMIRNATLSSTGASISTACTFDCPGNSQTISIKGSLQYLQNRIFSNSSMVHSAANLKSTAPDISSFFSLHTLYIFIGVVAGILILVGIGYLVLMKTKFKRM